MVETAQRWRFMAEGSVAIRGERTGYQQIAHDLTRRMREGEWAPGEKIPARNALAREYGVALATLERAVTALLAAGALCAARGLGTYVAEARSGSTIVGPASPHHPPTARHTVRPPMAAATRILGVILGYQARVADIDTREIQHPEQQIARAMEVCAHHTGAQTEFLHLTDWQRDPATALRATLALPADVRVFINVYEDPSWRAALLALAAECRQPLLYVTSEEEQMPCPIVHYDQVSLGYIAATHLLQAGYRRFFYLSPFSVNTEDQDWIGERCTGLRQACRQWNLPAGAVVRAPEQATIDLSSYQVTLRNPAALRARWDALLDQVLPWVRQTDPAQGPCAMVAPNDRVALTMLEALRERDIAIGAEIGVIGFDDIPEATIAGLTSVRPPWEALGETVVSLAERAYAGEALPIKSAVGATVIARRSTERISS